MEQKIPHLNIRRPNQIKSTKKILVLGVLLLFLTSMLLPAVGMHIVSPVSQKKDILVSLQAEDTDAVRSYQGLLTRDDSWWNTDWLYRKEIQINHSEVVSSLTNFPVLIALPSDSDLASKAQDDGDDIVFINAIGVKLNHEIELFDNVSGQLLVWVNITSLSSTENTTLWMYYGNNACGNQQNRMGVWDSSMLVRYAMKDLTASKIQDSTSYNNNGTKKAADEPVEASGLIGKAQDFDGVDDYITMGKNNLNQDLSGATGITFSAWINPASLRNGTLAERNTILDIPNNADKSAIMIFLVFGGDIRVGGRSRSLDLFQCATVTDVITINNWQHITGVLDFTNKEIYVYLNGTLIGQASSLAFGSNTYVSSTGGNETIGVNTLYFAVQFFDGLMDEIVISNTARNSSWIQTNYNNMNAPSAFFTIGVEQNLNLPPMFGAPSPANASINQPLSFTWNIPINDPDGDAFSWTIQCSNGQTNSGTSASNGTKTLALSGLAYVTTYTVWVNATDPAGSGLYTRAWYVFTTRPNLPPVFGNPSPSNGSGNQPLSLTWSIPISDPDGNTFTWSIQCSNGQTSGASGASNGTKTIVLQNLAYLTTYTVWVNATDPAGSGLYRRAWYVFTTKPNLPPVFGAPSPANGSYNQPLGFTWSIPINDPEGNTFTWTIQCSNGQSNSATSATNGTKSLALTDLADLTEYRVWVNATDPAGSGGYTRRWYVFSTGPEQNLPPYVPDDPVPANESLDVHINTNLSWSGGDPNPDDVVTYDVYFGSSFPLEQIYSNITETSVLLGTLMINTTYYWKIVAWDDHGASAVAPVWWFTTMIDNIPPTIQITTPAKGYLHINILNIIVRKIPIFFTTMLVGKVEVTVTAEDHETGIQRVEFYVDDELKATDTSAPYSWRWTDRGQFFQYTLRVVAYDYVGNFASKQITLWKIL